MKHSWKKPMKRAFVLFKCFFNKFTCSMSSHVRTPNIHGTPANSSREYYKFSLWSLSTELERAAVNWQTATCQIISSRVEKACMLCYINGESNFSVIKALGRNRMLNDTWRIKVGRVQPCTHLCVVCEEQKKRWCFISFAKYCTHHSDIWCNNDNFNHSSSVSVSIFEPMVHFDIYFIIWHNVLQKLVHNKIITIVKDKPFESQQSFKTTQ